MRFVPVKTEEQQSALTMHRVRELLVRQRTQLINAVRGHLAEFGLVVAQGPWNVPRLLASMQEDRRVPELARQVLELLAAQLDEVGQRIAEVDARIMAWHKAHPVSRRLATIPGIGPLIATAIAATVPDPDAFRGGREFAAWLGLVPRQRSTGGKQRLGRISRLGDKYIRQLLIVGAQTVLLRSKAARSNAWIQSLLARRPLGLSPAHGRPAGPPLDDLIVLRRAPRPRASRPDADHHRVGGSLVPLLLRRAGQRLGRLLGCLRRRMVARRADDRRGALGAAGETVAQRPPRWRHRGEAIARAGLCRLAAAGAYAGAVGACGAPRPYVRPLS
jgi:transposase